MLAELLAVVGGHEDRRVLVEAEGLQPFDELSDLAVVISELGVVELPVAVEALAVRGHQPRVEGRPRHVRIVEVERVKVEKEPVVPMGLEPRQDRFGDIRRIRIHVVEVRTPRSLLEAPHVHPPVESLIEEEDARVDDGIRDPGRGDVALVSEDLGERGPRARESVVDGARSMKRRKRRGEEARGRRLGPGGAGAHVLIEHRVAARRSISGVVSIPYP